MPMHYPYTLPQLPYDLDALEPQINTQQLTLHYTKHHQAYVDQLNKAIKDEPTLHALTIEELLKKIPQLADPVKTSVINFGGGVYNHTFFWRCLHTADTYPLSDALAQSISAQFGSVAQFKEQLSKTTTSLFGSGWTWLCLDQEKKLMITNTANQDCPLTNNLFPLLCIDLWEHAYYIQYHNRRTEFIEQWWHIINWHFVQQRYELGMHR